MSDGGKGSKPRPYSVSQQEYDTRWDAIFGTDLKIESDERLMKMPGTIGSADLVFRNNNESSSSNTDNRK